jgi:ABC-type transport system involved in multi-copper enzyme maturation permease subunit
VERGLVFLFVRIACMLKQVQIIARHELVIAIATRRAVAAAGLYLVTALLAGIGYVKSLQGMQRQAAQMLAERGANPTQAAEAVSRATHEAYEKLVVFFAGTSDLPVAASLTDSLILPAFLWGSLAFLPFLVVLTSFDVIAGDLQARSLCYSVLRAPRIAILLGKLLAQAALFVGLSVVASLALLGVAASLLDNFEIFSALPGLVRVWLVLLPYGICYLSLSAFCSAALRQPTLALIAAFGVMVALRILGLFAHIPEGHALAPLRYLRWLSPAQYQSGLWEAGLAGPLFSVVAYLTFAALFLVFATRVLDGRDL